MKCISGRGLRGALGIAGTGTGSAWARRLWWGMLLFTMVSRPDRGQSHRVWQRASDVALAFVFFHATERAFTVIGVRKVVFSNSWDDSTGKYKKDPNSEKTAVCDPRTAVEDVTEVGAVAQYYDNRW